MTYASHVFANSDTDYVTNLNNLRNDAEASASRGWITPAGTFTYASATTFTCAAAYATPFTTGTRVKFNAGTAFGTVTGQAGGATITITVTMDSGSVPNPITAVMYGMIDGAASVVPVATGSFAASGANSDLTALNAVISGTVFRRNFAINGGMRVAQSPAAAPSLSGTAQYGKVDGFTAWASAGTVGAGTITQATAASVGRTGYALHLSGVTLTGSGTLNIRQRIEALDAMLVKNATISVSCRVYQDTGSSATATLVVRKPTASDNYGSVTTIGTGSGVTVATATDVAVTYPNLSVGDCGNGLEIELQVVTGAITTKNVYVTEWQIEISPVVTTFHHEPVVDVLQRCRRYFQVLGGAASEIYYGVGTTASALIYTMALSLPVEMRIAPTAAKTGTWAVNGFGQPTIQAATKRAITFTATCAAIASSQSWNTAGASDYVTLDARL